MDDTKITSTSDSVTTQTDIKTSQQKAGEFSLPEGQNSAGPGPCENLCGDEMAPTGLSTAEAIKDPFKTTQQLKGEHSLPES
jgi:hypothetical protein